MEKIKNLKVRAIAFTLAATSMFSLAGCVDFGKELAANERYDIVENPKDDENDLAMGLTQILDVPGRNFKLVAKYACDDESKREWRITSDKFLYFSVCTDGLLDDTEVYIDNIHIDTSIKSKYAAMDGVIQDSMDDHVHSSQLIGFPVSDNTVYYGVNAIEGCNEKFIKGSFYGFNGYSSGSVSERRYSENDYLELGVYANKIQIVYDLLVKGPNDKDFTNISVSTDFLVPITSSEVNYEYSDGSTGNKEIKLTK